LARELLGVAEDWALSAACLRAFEELLFLLGDCELSLVEGFLTFYSVVATLPHDGFLHVRFLLLDHEWLWLVSSVEQPSELKHFAEVVVGIHSLPRFLVHPVGAMVFGATGQRVQGLEHTYEGALVLDEGLSLGGLAANYRGLDSDIKANAGYAAVVYFVLDLSAFALNQVVVGRCLQVA